MCYAIGLSRGYSTLEEPGELARIFEGVADEVVQKHIVPDEREIKEHQPYRLAPAWAP